MLSRQPAPRASPLTELLLPPTHNGHCHPYDAHGRSPVRGDAFPPSRTKSTAPHAAPTTAVGTTTLPRPPPRRMRCPLPTLDGAAIVCGAPIPAMHSPIAAMHAPMASTRAPMRSIRTPTPRIGAPMNCIRTRVAGFGAPMFSIRQRMVFVGAWRSNVRAPMRAIGAPMQGIGACASKVHRPIPTIGAPVITVGVQPALLAYSSHDKQRPTAFLGRRVGDQRDAYSFAAIESRNPLRPRVGTRVGARFSRHAVSTRAEGSARKACAMPRVHSSV